VSHRAKQIHAEDACDGRHLHNKKRATEKQKGVDGEPDQTSRHRKQNARINLCVRPEIPVKACKQEQVKECQAGNQVSVGIHLFQAERSWLRVVLVK